MSTYLIDSSRRTQHIVNSLVTAIMQRIVYLAVQHVTVNLGPFATQTVIMQRIIYLAVQHVTVNLGPLTMQTVEERAAGEGEEGGQGDDENLGEVVSLRNVRSDNKFG